MIRIAKSLVRLIRFALIKPDDFLLYPLALQLFTLAERVGFEPTVPVKAQQFSRLPDSTTLAPLRANL